MQSSSAGSAKEDAALIAGRLKAAGILHAAFDWYVRAREHRNH